MVEQTEQQLMESISIFIALGWRVHNNPNLTIEILNSFFDDNVAMPDNYIREEFKTTDGKQAIDGLTLLLHDLYSAAVYRRNMQQGLQIVFDTITDTKQGK